VRILVTNDDGIHAPGLEACANIARALSDDVWVVAPEFDQSGVSHSLSLNDPLRMRGIDDKRFAVKGTPTDCVIMAVRHIMAEKTPDLVLSGVNRGMNLAEDVTYSGTVAAAIEGTVLGIPSIALSQVLGPERRGDDAFSTAEAHAPEIIKKILKEGIPDRSLVNINFPPVDPDQVAGVQITTQGNRDQELLKIEPRHDGRGNPYYWIAFHKRKWTSGEGTDLAAIEKKLISVTPLRIDLTDEPYMTRLAAIFDKSDLTG
jgi:5'-nucleotidase